MEKVSTLKGIPGMLRPFKEYVTNMDLKEGSQIVYYGCPGTCTPFVELLSYAIRDMPVQNIFVPLLDESSAKSLVNVPKIGMQITGGAEKVDPSLIVILGGLSMDNVPVSAADMNAVISKYDCTVIGSCCMSMFEKSGWVNEIDFDLVIDAVIDPVDLYSR
ncbi:DUF2124 domain-containing protein [Methanoplanus endosymbiosus]|uniref:DUF2124 domain-containing protein n=1 Tax=Methanoplanus endosymbiosus TaxID=33865 RepID=A0A9E7PPH2_9EURY|nr:DUF2124 domain-containing protein [Methanoplanus endosymbiosus]UUX93670.1 DUF2124 domain-containing protein [Methanoplanus endosymbiosus]